MEQMAKGRLATKRHKRTQKVKATKAPENAIGYVLFSASFLCPFVSFCGQIALSSVLCSLSSLVLLC